MTFKLRIPGRHDCEDEAAAIPRFKEAAPNEFQSASAANPANPLILDPSISRLAELAANEASNQCEAVEPISRLAGLAGIDDCETEAKRARSSIISANGAALWQADSLAGMQPWTEREIDAFQKRQVRIALMGYGGASEYLAEKLLHRDRESDNRRLCVECAHCRAGHRCGKNEGFMLEQLQRCDKFQEGHVNE